MLFLSGTLCEQEKGELGQEEARAFFVRSPCHSGACGLQGSVMLSVPFPASHDTRGERALQPLSLGEGLPLSGCSQVP